ncbi:endonuclease/exonuclease/phosphatase family protein [Prauserella shujinwangii]|nr:endonuclease/exonuclease/phosphatase family protein [Prauserella shujinwangii]
MTLALALAGILASLVPAASAEHGARVLATLSFNIHHAEGTDGVLDLDRIAGVIRASRADVVALQEVDRHYSGRSEWVDQAGELARRLDLHVVFGANIDRDPPAEGRPRVQYGTAILSRHPIVDWDNTYLYRSPGQEQRGLLHAELDVHGVPVHVYNTHLAASSALDRRHQTAEIVELIGDTRRAVLLGDINALPDAPEVATLSSALTDVWPVSGRGDGATYPAEDPDRRIDYVFTGPAVRPLVSRVQLTDPAASDHLPLFSRVLVSARG